MIDPDAEQLAGQFAATHSDVITLISQATETELATLTREEGWPVLVVGHHLAFWYPQQGQWLREVAAGQAVSTTTAHLDEANAQMVAQVSSLTRAKVLAELYTNGSALEAIIRHLTAQELVTAAPVGLAGGRPMTVADMVQHIVLAHLAEHVPHMRAAIIADASA
jgi:hypothetical protein